VESDKRYWSESMKDAATYTVSRGCKSEHWG